MSKLLSRFKFGKSHCAYNWFGLYNREDRNLDGLNKIVYFSLTYKSLEAYNFTIKGTQLPSVLLLCHP